MLFPLFLPLPSIFARWMSPYALLSMRCALYIMLVDITSPVEIRNKYHFRADFNSQLDLVLKSEEGGDVSDFITNGEWFLLGKLSACCCTIIPIFKSPAKFVCGIFSFYCAVEIK